jgi:xanthine dehydrogenase accessory factor
MITHPDVLSRAAQLRAEGTSFVLATVVASYPPQSVRAGAKAILFGDDRIEGWIGGGCVRPVVLQEAREALADGRPRLVRMNAGTTPTENHDRAQGSVRDYPMTCQGEGGVEIYLEPVQPAPRLVIFGRTPVAEALARLAGEIGFQVGDALPHDRTVGASTFVVVATMGAGDEDSLADAVRSGAPYVGLVASRKKASFLLDYLRASGVPDEQLSRVKAPAGLDLGGMSAPEIALSILAEIVQRRYAPATPVVEPTAPHRRSLALAADAFPTDPICGMRVDPATAKHTLVEEGRTIYFCCPHCKAKYEKAHAR